MLCFVAVLYIKYIKGTIYKELPNFDPELLRNIALHSINTICFVLSEGDGVVSNRTLQQDVFQQWIYDSPGFSWF